VFRRAISFKKIKNKNQEQKYKKNKEAKELKSNEQRAN
jgi:hypothetical protein